MKKAITTSIQIHAKPEKVWQILTDFVNYPNWNPFITSIQGEAVVGNNITMRIEPPNGKGMIFKPVILERIENKKLTWLGKLFFKGLFDGKHSFELLDTADGSTTLLHAEEFSGVLVGILNLDNTEKGFIAMNNQLKHLAEKAQNRFPDRSNMV
jgi:hypothetical protein